MMSFVRRGLTLGASAALSLSLTGPATAAAVVGSGEPACACAPEEIGAASYDYLMYSGYVVLAYWWARAVASANASAHPQSFKDDKRDTARFYFARILPRTLAHAAALESGIAGLPELAIDAT